MIERRAHEADGSRKRFGATGKDWDYDPGGINWMRVFVHGFLGLVVGTIAGMQLYLNYYADDIRGHSLCVIPEMAVVVALIAVLLGDTFWDWLTGHWQE